MQKSKIILKLMNYSYLKKVIQWTKDLVNYNLADERLPEALKNHSDLYGYLAIIKIGFEWFFKCVICDKEYQDYIASGILPTPEECFGELPLDEDYKPTF